MIELQSLSHKWFDPNMSWNKNNFKHREKWIQIKIAYLWTQLYITEMLWRTIFKIDKEYYSLLNIANSGSFLTCPIFIFFFFFFKLYIIVSNQASRTVKLYRNRHRSIISLAFLELCLEEKTTFQLNFLSSPKTRSPYFFYFSVYRDKLSIRLYSVHSSQVCVK